MNGHLRVKRDATCSLASMPPHAVPIAPGSRHPRPHAVSTSHATSPLRTSHHARTLVNARHLNATPALSKPDPNEPARRTVCAPRHCCTVVSRLPHSLFVEGACRRVGCAPNHLRVHTALLLAVGRCLAGYMCTVPQGAQLTAAGWRAAYGGTTVEDAARRCGSRSQSLGNKWRHPRV
jgi:hypothetical protein